MAPRKLDGVISGSEAAAAIYLDFEGYAAEAPALMGVLVDGVFEQVVLHPALGVAASARGLRLSTLRSESERLLSRCMLEGRRLVAFSQHELQVLALYGGLDFTAHYRDARKIAKRWWNRTHPRTPLDQRDLKTMLELIGYPRPKYLGIQKSTHRLTGVLDGLARGKGYEALTPTQKGKWSRLLEHNRIDCFGMAALVAEAAS